VDHSIVDTTPSVESDPVHCAWRGQTVDAGARDAVGACCKAAQPRLVELPGEMVPVAVGPSHEASACGWALRSGGCQQEGHGCRGCLTG
jgi:hypothetical protein